MCVLVHGKGFAIPYGILGFYVQLACLGSLGSMQSRGVLGFYAILYGVLGFYAILYGVFGFYAILYVIFGLYEILYAILYAILACNPRNLKS